MASGSRRGGRATTRMSVNQVTTSAQRASTTFAVVGERGQRLGTHVVETSRQALAAQLEVIVPGPTIAFERRDEASGVRETRRT